MSNKENRLQAGDYVKHFKGKYYKILLIVTNATNGMNDETLVIYQALYGDFKVYAREYNEFMSKVDKAKYPNISQEYRMEKVTIEDAIGNIESEITAIDSIQIYKGENNG